MIAKLLSTITNTTTTTTTTATATATDTYFNLSDNIPGGPQLFQWLSRRDGEDEDERVTFGDVESLHSGELVRAGRVGYLQGAYIVLVARYHLLIHVNWSNIGSLVLHQINWFISNMTKSAEEDDEQVQ